MARGRLVTIHCAFWAAVCLLYIIDSAPRLVKALRADVLNTPAAFHSIDKYLAATAGMTDGSRRISDALTLLPDKTRPIGIVKSEEPVSSFIGMVVAYLAWPREIRFIPPATDFPSDADAALDRKSLSGVVFCDVNTPWWARKRVQLSPTVTLVPSPGTTEPEAP